MTGNPPVAVTVSGGVARVALKRPDKRNALDSATIAGLGTVLADCAENADVRVVQITGTGDVFCAGADLSEMQAQSSA